MSKKKSLKKLLSFAESTKYVYDQSLHLPEKFEYAMVKSN